MMRFVFQSTFNADASEPKTANYEKLKQKKEQMVAVYAKLKVSHYNNKKNSYLHLTSTLNDYFTP